MVNQNTKLSKEVDSKIEKIYALLVSDNSVAEIAKILGYGYGSIYNAIIRNGLSHFIGVHRNGKSKTSRTYQKNQQKFTEDILYKKYHTEKKNMYEIAEEYKITPSAVLYNMRKFNIKSRTKEEAMRLMYDNNPEIRNILRKLAYDGKIGIYRKNAFLQPSKIEQLFEKYCVDNKISYVKQYQINSVGHRYDFKIYDNTLIEIDGDYWHNTDKQKILDERHNELAIESGYVIIRFAGSHIKKTKGKCFDNIRNDR